MTTCSGIRRRLWRQRPDQHRARPSARHAATVELSRSARLDRFHDLRHTVLTELAEMRGPSAGLWVPSASLWRSSRAPLRAEVLEAAAVRYCAGNPWLVLPAEYWPTI